MVISESLERYFKRMGEFFTNVLLQTCLGGHANDGDEFLAFVEIKTEEHLIEVANKLGIEMEILPEDNPKPIPGKA